MSVSTYEEVTQRDEKALIIKKKVDELLERKKYEQIISLFKEEEVRRLAGCNRNIYILYTIIHTTEFEIK